ncbi:hypothetical protein ZIOFF_024191 [Zingiber officinale]|uniref:Uncharacterized protein n=1 Tax=Zingiber officinale TaxID=94328 RepID=A0A8J5H1Z8_ZINOF|nr:hypothetical protein ZIOFF_024191 [Zingiber officinale]
MIASSSCLRRRPKEQPPTPLDTEAAVHFGRRLVSPSIHRRPWEIGDAEVVHSLKSLSPLFFLLSSFDLFITVSLTLHCCPNWFLGGHGVAPSDH